MGAPPMSSAEQPHQNAEQLPETSFSRRIDRYLLGIGRLVSWLWVILIATVILNVTARYLFNQGYIELEEIQWHLYSTGFLLGLSYCLVHNSHIRVDLLHERMSLRMQAWVEFYGLLLLFFPFVLFIIIESIPFVHYAFITNEISPAAGGLPFRWIIKAMLPLGFLLLAMAGGARLLRVIHQLTEIKP